MSYEPDRGTDFDNDGVCGKVDGPVYCWPRRGRSALIRRIVVNTGERKERRGFASMSAEKQREIASKGGRAAHEKGTAHEWTADEARNAGRKGGQVSRGGRGRLIVPDAATANPAASGNNTVSGE